MPLMRGFGEANTVAHLMPSVEVATRVALVWLGVRLIVRVWQGCATPLPSSLAWPARLAGAVGLGWWFGAEAVLTGLTLYYAGALVWWTMTPGAGEEKSPWPADKFNRWGRP